MSVSGRAGSAARQGAVTSSAVPVSLPRPQYVAAYPLAELAVRLGADPTPVRGIAVTGVTHASGAVRPGDLFAALPSLAGDRHGARYAPAAAAAGAAAVLTNPAGAALVAPTGLPALVVPDPRAVLGEVAAQIYGEPGTRMQVIGVTGTAGKTSTVYLIEAGLRAAGRKPALLSTVETRLDDLVLESVRTTPEATDLHALLAAALERGVDAVAMEVSSHALALERVGGLRYAAGGWTNLGQDHLDFHRDLTDYYAAKAKLFDGRCRVEILNADDPALRDLTRSTTVTFSAEGDQAATWYATDVVAQGYGQRFIAHGPAGAVPAGVAQPGRHSVANALLAIAALDAVGVPPEVAAKGVAACTGVPGRLEVVAGDDGGTLGVVDYAHKPDAVVAALTALTPVVRGRGGRLICVIGAGGERDPGKRPHMGASAARLADLLIVTDDNPRSEDPARIRAAVLSGVGTGVRARELSGHRPPEVIEIAGRRAAIEAAARRAGPADVVAVLGKGHERGQEIAGEVHPFDDRTVLAEALGGAG